MPALKCIVLLPLIFAPPLPHCWYLNDTSANHNSYPTELMMNNNDAVTNSNNVVVPHHHFF